MILFFGVDVPNVRLISGARKDVLNGFERCTHGVVKVIVAVLAVATDAEEVRDFV